MDVVLEYPEAGRGEKLIARATWGGSFEGGGNTLVFDLARERTVRLRFIPGSHPGLYEIALRRGMQDEAIHFWVPTGNAELDSRTLH